MLQAAALGAAASATLVVGAVVAYLLRPGPRLVAAVMAFGSGLLVGSVAYDLVEDAHLSIDVPLIALFLLAGATAFVLGSRAIDGWGRRRRRASRARTAADDASDQGDSDDGGPLSIVLGSALDGVPESLVLGMSLVHGAASGPLLVGIALSNLPEGIAGSTGLRAKGWPMVRTVGLWALVVGVSAAAAAIGHEVVEADDRTWMGIAQTFAAGALLAMISDSMIPEAYEVERAWTGLLVVAGFCGSLVLAAWLG